MSAVRASEYFALQLDESTGVSNAAELLVYIISQDNFVEGILFCTALKGRASVKIFLKF